VREKRSNFPICKNGFEKANIIWWKFGTITQQNEGKFGAKWGGK
jgi:hypothetical protein